MNRVDFESENKDLLLGRWNKLNSGEEPSRIGVESQTANLLRAASKDSIERSADMRFPLFELVNDSAALKAALNARPDHDPEALDAELFNFLVNRREAARKGVLFAQTAYRLTREACDLLVNATVQQLMAAASSRANLIRLSAPYQYFFHAHARFDKDSSQRTALFLTSMAA